MKKFNTSVSEAIWKLKDTPSRRLAVFIRHGEKYKSSTNIISITEKAKIETKLIGLRFRALNISIKIYSSPELRCIETAQIINREISPSNNEITFTSFLGNPGIQVKNNDKYLDVFYKSDVREIYRQWKNCQHYDALRTPEELKSEFLTFTKKIPAEQKISLLISQSGTLANLGYALGVLDLDVNQNEWVPFLRGFVVAY